MLSMLSRILCLTCHQWELEVGKRYELFLTTNDGLWRYRQEDIVEVTGFAPDDGQPVLRFIERRG